MKLSGLIISVLIKFIFEAQWKILFVGKLRRM